MALETESSIVYFATVINLEADNRADYRFP